MQLAKIITSFLFYFSAYLLRWNYLMKWNYRLFQFFTTLEAKYVFKFAPIYKNKVPANIPLWFSGEGGGGVAEALRPGEDDILVHRSPAERKLRALQRTWLHTEVT